MIATASSGCSKSPPVELPLTRDLPAEPAFAQTVTVQHRVDDDLLVVAGRERAGRAQANEIILCFVEWYRGVRANYGQDAADQAAAGVRQACDRKAATRAKRP